MPTTRVKPWHCYFLAYSFCGQIPEADTSFYPKIAHLKGTISDITSFLWGMVILHSKLSNLANS
jgi:hypothetical protein